MRLRLNKQTSSQAAFINELRKLRGLPDLKVPNHERAIETVEAFADRATAQLAKELQKSGADIEDKDEQ